MPILAHACTKAQICVTSFTSDLLSNFNICFRLEKEKKEWLNLQRTHKSKVTMLLKNQKSLEATLNKLEVENENLLKQVSWRRHYGFYLWLLKGPGLKSSGLYISVVLDRSDRGALNMFKKSYKIRKKVLKAI